MVPSKETVAVTDRLASFEADLLNVHIDFPPFLRLALPIRSGRGQIPKNQDTRMIRWMEVPLHGGSSLAGLAIGAYPRSHSGCV